MRLVRVLVRDADVESAAATLDEYDVDYLVFREERDDGRVLVEFPLPTQAVETVLDDLRDAVQEADPYTVVVSAESVSAEHFDELEDRFVTGTEEDDSIPTEEVRTRALDMTPSPKTYYSMTLLSALVATAGLLADSPAIVVGSMVIAPLVGSALTASVGTVLDDRTMVLEGFQTQILGLVVAVVGAVAFSVFLKFAVFLPPALDVTTTDQIVHRTSPGLLSTVVGLAAGAAGAFGLATGVSVTLVGVMIAAALIPAAAAVGIGIAWGIQSVALGAALLLVLNTITIHLAGAVVLWVLGYGSEDLREGALLPRPGTSTNSMLAVGAVLLVVLAGTGLAVSSHVAFEQDVNAAVDDVLSQDSYAELELLSVQTAFHVSAPVTLGGDQEVTVVVSRPADTPYPELSGRISERIERRTGRDVTVVVEFVDQQRHS